MIYKVDEKLDINSPTGDKQKDIEGQVEKNSIKPENLVKITETFISLAESMIIRIGLLFLLIYKLIGFILYSIS